MKLFLLAAVISLSTISVYAQYTDKDSISVAIFEQFSLKRSDQPESKTFLKNYSAIIELGHTAQFNKIIDVYTKCAARSAKQGHLKEAEEIILKDAIPLSFRYGDDKTNYTLFMALAKNYYEQKKFTQSKWFFIQSNIVAKKLGNSTGQLLSLVGLAKVKQSIGDNALAMQDYKEAQKLAIKLNFQTTLTTIKNNMAALTIKPGVTNKDAISINAVAVSAD